MASTLRSWTLACVAGAATGATAATFGALARSGWQVLSGPSPADPADILLTMVAALGFVLALWLGVGTVLSALAQLPGAIGAACERIAVRVAPGTAAAGPVTTPRHTVAASLADPASDTVTVPDPGFHPLAADDASPDPGFRPPAPGAPPVNATLGALGAATSRAAGSVEDQYVVRRGDTLWDVAARHLGPRGSAAAIAREWPRWYAANRAVIGPNPHHIEAGQRLRPPDATTEAAPR